MRVLLIEDMASLQMLYRLALEREGIEVHVAGTADEGREAFERLQPDIVLLDLLLPDADGLELLRGWSLPRAEHRVIVITAHGSVNRAVAAMKAGAFDFLVKPFEDARLVASVRNAMTDLRKSRSPARARAVNGLGLDGFVGNSRPMREIFATLSRVAPSAAPVFITGETGTGKLMCARALHALSNRAEGPFEVVNCEAEPGPDLAARLFGGPGAPGALARAEGGTLVLANVEAMDMESQTRLLRFLQAGQVGGADRADVRIACVSRQLPLAAVESGAFREDLFFRLNVVHVGLPPLAQREDDAIAIAQDALPRLAAAEGKRFVGLSRDVKRTFAAHPWPGNVRQLLNLLRSVVMLHDGPELELSMLPAEFLCGLNRAGEQRVSQAGPSAEPTTVNGFEGAIAALAASGRSFAEIERDLIEAVIEHNDGSVPQAARQLGLSPSTLYRKREAWKQKAS